MRTHRFGRKILLPSTMAIKHQIRMLMAEDEARKAGGGSRPNTLVRARALDPPDEPASAGVRLVDPSGDEGSPRRTSVDCLTRARSDWADLAIDGKNRCAI
jgi:hypothetical protein